jgi:redox-sensitive bicupin YhaK (pirin superfamily)
MNNFSETDPFILFMDDVFQKKNKRHVDGPHPYAGFETATLVLQGESGYGVHKLLPGDFELMTAGSGIIHSETIDRVATRRTLQVRLTLPKQHRWMAPRIQNLSVEHVPKIYKSGVHIKVYSGAFADLVSPIQNNIPLIVADIEMAGNVRTVLELPANYNSFLYMLRGSLKIGDEKKLLNENETGFLNIVDDDVQSDLKLIAGEQGTRFLLYAAKPIGENIVAYGPFIGDTSEDINHWNHEYVHDRMRHISTIPETRKIVW